MTTQDAFDEVRAGLASLLADLPRLPSALRVEAQGVVIELTWQTAAPAAHQVAAALPAEPVAGAAPPAQPDPGLHHVTAPTVGVFYRSPEPGAAPFVDIGSVVVPGEQVGIVEAMKLFLPVEAGHPGRVVEMLVEDGEPVEFGTPLITLEPVGV
jgi:acetyl-CoA carboxylase biotin carboxyl carrier protein